MPELGKVGIWSRELRSRDLHESADAVAELESLGYGTTWMPGGSATDFFPRAEAFIEATAGIVVAAGILSVWTNPAAEVAEARASIAARHPNRFLLGLGVSHAHRVEQDTGRRYEHVLAVMREYLDALDASANPVPRDALMLAALGPRMLALSGDRSSGAHPYFVSPEHTRFARTILGVGPLLAPEQAVVLETDPDRARAIARRHTQYYLGAPNYVNNLLRSGFTQDDVRGDGSDRLVDAIVAWGSPAVIRARIAEHFAAGADHVCIQVVPADPDAMPLPEWRTLAEALHDI